MVADRRKQDGPLEDGPLCYGLAVSGESRATHTGVPTLSGVHCYGRRHPRGSRMQRYFRDIAMYRVQGSSHEYVFTPGLARAHFGLPVGNLFAR